MAYAPTVRFSFTEIHQDPSLDGAAHSVATQAVDFLNQVCRLADMLDAASEFTPQSFAQSGAEMGAAVMRYRESLAHASAWDATPDAMRVHLRPVGLSLLFYGQAAGVSDPDRFELTPREVRDWAALRPPHVAYPAGCAPESPPLASGD